MTAPANSIAEFYETAVTQLESAGLSFGHGCTCAEDEVAWLLSATLDIPFDELDKFWSDALTDEQRATLTQRLNERCATKTPLAYILGEAWLGPYIFKIDRRVIVPRSFIAELLMDDLSPWVQNPEAITRVADICTGSSCLAILAALHFPNSQVDAVDLSPEALEVARINVDLYGLEDRLKLHQGDLMAPLMDQKYDIIISNPPYVDAASMDSLPGEYRHEPEMALAGGKDGLDLVHTLMRQAAQTLNPGGWLIVEIGHNKDVMTATYPNLPLVWLDTDGGNDFVFLIDQASLKTLI
ncbi:MAG: 50S ribosomal protein L3 N(5)-glutamine methyltransferase [Rhodocyclaceae bacterium]|uniref:50S ribosomal protein L3 glutamine methyltransferase n=1 Tax=Fluviibacter phosphoraccumulans TaxID=1751046 RepID=A0A679I640_9RHOO|nr:50S ribosomal protein L3 N(5)-glutamine methyltransferase [Fluviibacter phosphoraccumulans]MBP7991712.1 50S ribosomal protein L3 N(5)-glutamine methyltransferase [Rhodocyclaceae bacterium]BBU69515.1 50S ribosomal protein L3 glutamine methyltransferase [Fluviibacter phosphoraccumulans]BBU71302.1 50S ribosomal protein L3 glutamine methyltransferase [Fluviibacter phosphoraccumulans]BCA65454.1 50S ribosomal protein L3 glutamine methyltransferase [Fluviibacter phosphoraccumulans]